MNATAVAVAFTGVAAAGLDANANAEGVGIDGGDDDDVISNAGDIEGTATATARARTLSLGSLAGLAGFDSIAQSNLYGLSGGFGNDTIRNSGTIDLLSEAGATGQSATGSLIGVSITSASAESTANAERAGVSDLVRFIQQDALEVDLSDATVVTLYLLSSSNMKLRPVLTEQLPTGARIVSHAFSMGNWDADLVERFTDSRGNTRTLYLWTHDGTVRP